MAKKYSCGIIVKYNTTILLGHITGQNKFDIPKGGPNVNETFIQTAIRETYEECGLMFNQTDLTYLGKFYYTKNKDLYLYMIELDKPIDISKLYCMSTFKKQFKEIKEIDYHCMVEIADLHKYISLSLLAVLHQIF